MGTMWCGNRQSNIRSHWVCQRPNLAISRYAGILPAEPFTGDIKFWVFQFKWCAQAGSCVGDKCNTASSDETLNELGRYKRFLGYSGYTSLCGHMLCGCLLPLPACQSYKVMNTPISQAVYEIVRCSEWTPTIGLNEGMRWRCMDRREDRKHKALSDRISRKI